MSTSSGTPASGGGPSRPLPVRPWAVERYVALIACVAVVAIVMWWWASPPADADPFLVGAVTFVGILSVLVPIRYFHGSAAQGYNLEGAAFLALLLATSPAVAVSAVAAGSFVAFSFRTRSATKAIFNASQNAIWSSAAALVFLIIGPGSDLIGLRTAAAIVAAGMTMTAVNAGLLAELMRRLGGTPRVTAMRDAVPVLVPTLVGNATAGYVLGILVDQDPWGVVPGALLMLGLQLGYRGYVASAADQRRAERLHDVTKGLLEAAIEPRATEIFLERVRALLGAMSAEVAVQVGGRDVAAILDADGHRTLDAPSAEVLAVLARLQPTRQQRADGRPVLAAPLVHSGTTIGAIAVTGRRGLEPWDESDLHLLATVANEAAVVLKNVELFSQLERERARLEAESTKLGDIVNAASDGIVLIGSDGKVQAWNDAMAEVTGVAPAEAVDHPWYVSLRLKDAADRELLPEGEHVISDALRGHRHSEAVAIQVLRRDGRWRWLRVTLAPVLREDAEPIGTVLVARDVTSEREIEELKSDFIATVSHELRTPLTPLKGFLTTLVHRGDQMGPEQLNPVFSAMQGQVDRLERLIADLLVIADLDRGAITLERAHVDVGDAIRHVVGLEGPDRVVVELAEPTAAIGDDDAIRRVLRALVSNAVKHTDGTVRVAVERRDDEVLVHVDDEGPGIAPWDQERIFKRFGRLGDHLTRTQGPGLGLPIARALAQRMGGDVEVVSDVDRGSRFTVHLPVARPRAVADGREVGIAGAV